MWKKIRLIFWSILLVGVGFFGNAVWQALQDSTASILRDGLVIISQPLVSRLEEVVFKTRNTDEERTQNLLSQLTSEVQNQIQNQKPSHRQDSSEGKQAYDNGSYLAAYAKWRPLAELGYAEMQNNVGVMYALGQGVAQDYQAAHIWFNIAIANGYEEATIRRNYMQNRLSPDAIAEAQRIANQCIKNEYRDCP